MKKLFAAMSLCALVFAPPPLRAQTQANKLTASRPETTPPLNQINPKLVITPKEATAWHALKTKGGPAFFGNPAS